MTPSSTIVVVFDQLSREDFFRRLEWPALVRAWSKTIEWHYLSAHKVLLELSGLDGIDRLTITRRRRGDRIFIGARDRQGTLIQSGVWEYESESGLCICYRRVYRPELVGVLRERLADFVCTTFMK
ncbi:hypothetical protein V2T44_18255 [Serratia ficaria]|uniref:hypothetical protein n=1 Tax=Serratia ficaria TaxID=61651 RepID=UPI0021838053|nr:hypothetical protein [Serratia ficaria]MEE4484881.1 hypothetical protein [Serratia ficaria]CAI2467724.1 Uncharacterised protein [Serratia ficaria]